MRYLLAGGGTGGHVYPLLTVVESLTESDVSTELLYLGNGNSIEESLCQRAGIEFRAIAAGAMRAVSTGTRLASTARLVAGTAQSLAAILEFRPHAALVSGGYASVPPVIACWLTRCPVLIYLPDLVPGLAIRTMARFARGIAISFPEVASHLPAGKAHVTGYPVRQAIYQTERGAARERLGLNSDEPVILAMGGSRGARTINRAVAANLAALLQVAVVIHVTGNEDIDEMQAEKARLAPALEGQYRVHAYLHEELVDAMAAADLVVARAGAATLAEFPAAGLAAVLVPYPYSGQHQDYNAEYMVQRGCAIKIEDGRLAADLVPAVTALLSDAERLEQMRTNARKLAVPDAAGNIASLLTRLASERAKGTEEV